MWHIDDGGAHEAPFTFRLLRGLKESLLSLKVCFAIVLTILLSSCSTYEKRTLDHQVESKFLTDLYVNLSTFEANPDSGLGTDWFPLATTADLSDGLSLSEANSIGLHFNPELIQTRRKFDLAGSQLVQAGLLKNPQLSIGPRFSTSSSNTILPASLSWDLPLWGTRESGIRLAESEVKTKSMKLQELELELLNSIRITFVELWALTESVKVFGDSLKISEWISTRVESLRNAGEINASTYWLAKWESSQLSYQLETTRLDLQRQNYLLQRLLGLPPSEDLVAMAENSQIVPDLMSREPITQNLHPSLRLAEENYNESEIRVEHEYMKQFPKIQIGPEYEKDNSSTSIGFGLGMTLPIFDRNQNGITAAKIRRDAARDHYREVLLELKHLESSSSLSIEILTKLLRDSRELFLMHFESAKTTLETRLGVGESEIFVALTTSKALIDSRIQQIRLQADLTKATLEMATASGLVFVDALSNKKNGNPEGE